ncbi:carboxyl-terminal processing protease [Alkalibacillus flavidus]|uniref:Carboxyl-terminal processing protease n=1 Tax=Alkalibacillus flavidus TaxID=546021 RepID=A0ABV2KWL7_9BACI
MNLSRKYLVVLILVAFLIGGALSATAVSMVANGDEPNEETASEESNDTDQSSDSSTEDNSDSEDVSSDASAEVDQINQIVDAINEYYIDDVDRETLYEGALQGVVNALDDPFSQYMDEEMTDQFNQSLESSFEGIGAEVTERDGFITVVSPIKDSPAEAAGLRPNDRILAVDGESVEDQTVQEAVQIIRGEKGTDVVLTIQRPGDDETFDVTITRDEIPLETVHSSVQEYNGNTVGVLEITSFGEGTAQEFDDALTSLEEDENIDGLVLDVRGNPGGLFNAVENMLSHFVSDEDPFVYTKRHDAERDPYYVDGEGKPDYPVTVLIDQGSASASEILAAALNEIHGYDLVGQTTFGKGTVQQTMPLNEGMLKLTVFNWITPDGNLIQDKGVDPTIEQRQPEYFYTGLIQSDEPLEYDMTGNEVEKLQIMLEGLGYDVSRTDGYFDMDTVAAVEHFQDENGLDVTGSVGEETELQLEDMILEAVQNPENDVQLDRAIEALYE